MKTIDFVCQACGAERSAEEGSAAPICCGLPMKLQALPVCTIPSTAETARPGNPDGPCDDGTGKGRR